MQQSQMDAITLERYQVIAKLQDRVSQVNVIRVNGVSPKMTDCQL